MQVKLRGVALVLAVLIGLGVFAGLIGAKLRYHVEARNRRVEIGVEWPEIALLAQMSQQTIPSVLQQFKAQHVTTLIIPEDTLVVLEQAGAVNPVRITTPDGRYGTRVTVDSEATLRRIYTALQSRGIAPGIAAEETPLSGETQFVLPANRLTGQPALREEFAVNYTYLRLLGMGLPSNAVTAAQDAHLHLAGRIGNFAGIRETTAEAVLKDLKHQGVSVVIFSGDDTLGYRGLEKSVAELLRDPKQSASSSTTSNLTPTGLIFGEVEFTKQRGDEKLAAALHGDFVRVHTIQGAESGQIEEPDAIERYVKAVRERNIRFCYVRLWTQAGTDTIGENVEFLKKISEGMEKGNDWTGGGVTFGLSRPFEDTVSPDNLKYLKLLFGIMALGAASGTVWLLRLVSPLGERGSWLALISVGVVCFGLGVAGGETGRKIVALLAGIVFPTIACLLTFPRFPAQSDPHERNGVSESSAPAPKRPLHCLNYAVYNLLFASSVTALGIVLVIGLLATRPFMVHENQFLGIKAQHAVPLVILAALVLTGGIGVSGETWERFRDRLQARTKLLLAQPAQYGMLLAIGVALFALMVIIARTGNDSSVGISGGELKFRAVLETLLVARPRTKDLVGHPAFILAMAWAWRGRRKLAIPTFLIGCIGQVSLLNTFCHIHTPLIISLWRDGLGLLLGTIIGGLIFFLSELILPKRDIR